MTIVDKEVLKQLAEEALDQLGLDWRVASIEPAACGENYAVALAIPGEETERIAVVTGRSAADVDLVEQIKRKVKELKSYSGP